MLNKRAENLVSIVVSNYNNAIYIEECLNSLIKQTYKNIEIIIVDDCSTDGSIDVIERWISRRNKEEQSKIKFLKMPENTGFSGAVTAGMYLCKGEYIAMQDGDDYSKSNRIEMEVNYLKNNKDIKMVGCNYAIFRNYTEEEKLVPNGIISGKEKIKNEFKKGNSPVCFGTILFKGEIFDKIGGLTRNYDGAEDYEFIAKSVDYGIDNIKSPLYLYRKHEYQRSKKYYKDTDYFKDQRDKSEMNILLVLDKLNAGSTENYALSMAEELIKQGAKIIVAAGEGPLSSEFKKLKCKVYNVNFSSRIHKDINLRNRFISRLDKIIKKENINLIKAYQSASGSVAIEAGKKYKILYTYNIDN